MRDSRTYPKTVEEGLEAAKEWLTNDEAPDLVPTNEWLVDLSERLLLVESWYEYHSELLTAGRPVIGIPDA